MQTSRGLLGWSVLVESIPAKVLRIRGYVLYGAPSEAFTQEIRTKRFTYTVSNAPVRNVIAIEAT